MGLKNKNRINKKGLLLALTSLILLSSIYLGVSLLNSGSANFTFIQVPNASLDLDIEIAGSEDFEHFKQFDITENTGSNQTDVIIDPINFTEQSKYCFKDSLRVYKAPYGVGDELISQIYNLEPYAWETFSSSTDWGNPSGWTVQELSDTSVRVLPRFGGHKKVVELYDNSSTNWCYIQHDFSNQVNGTYYITTMTTSPDTYNGISVTGANGYAVSVAFNSSGTFYYGHSSGYSDSGIPYEANKWYTFKINFDCSIDQYSAYFWDDTNLNWSIITENTGFRNVQTTVYRFHIESAGPQANKAFYVAAIDNSWDVGYQEDRILYVSSADIAFIDNLTGSETKSYRIYYNSTPTAPAAYTDISRTGYTVNFTDGASVLMHTDNGVNYDILRQFDKNGNEHLSGRSDYHETSTYDTGAGGWITNKPIISDGPIFVESWHVDSSSRWSVYKYYANSYIYKYHNYPGSGVTGWFVWGAEADEATIDFNGVYYHQSSSWQYEAFDYTGASWQSHPNAVDAGKMFQEDTGDPNILITIWETTQDPYLDDILIRECGWPNPANVFVTIGRNPTFPYPWEVINSFGAWQFFLDAGTTNVTEKQGFVDNLHNLMIVNPPTIGILGPRNGTPDTQPPNIIMVTQDPVIPSDLDMVSITAHITDETGVDTVLINTNYTGIFLDYPTDFLSGTPQNGYWNYTIPQQPIGTTINYTIWANDTNGNSTSSSVYQYQVIFDELPTIQNVTINNKRPRPLDIINITARVTDDKGISKVLIYTDLYGSFQYFEMNLTSGTLLDGYWSYVTFVPLNASKKTISYQIWANDTSGQVNNSSVYEFKVKKNPKPIIIIPPGEDITIIIIIIIGSIAASSLVATTVIIKRRSPKVKSKKVMKGKRKIGVKLGAKEIRTILAESEETKPEQTSFEDVEKMLKKPFKVISDDLYSRVQNLRNLSQEDKELLLKDLANLDEEQIEEWLKEVEDLED